jgi:hypothetical protein
MAITARLLTGSLGPSIVAPVFSCWDHFAHKGFAPPLSSGSVIETNTNQYLGKIAIYLNKTRGEI